MHMNANGVAWLIWMKGDFLNGENVAVSTLSPNAKSWSQPETLAEQNGIQ